MINLDSLIREIGCDSIVPLARDVSPREYFRVMKEGQSYVLMLYPDANEAHQAELNAFIRIDEWLVAQGISAPQIHMVNHDKCYALLEDLGALSFGGALRDGGVLSQSDLYALGGDVLRRLARATPPHNLPHYGESRIHANRRQLIDYYFPLETGKRHGDDLVAQYYAVWDEIEASLPPCPQGFVHGDFHLENLMLRPQYDGLARCALIDFQDALSGPLPYDLVNLLEDARVDVPQSIRSNVLDAYCSDMDDATRDAFLKWYRVLGTQFHGRVIGLFVKLAAEQGRDQYLVHVPRLQEYIQNGVNDPVLAPLKAWFAKVGVDFSSIKDFNGAEIRRVFQNLAC